MDNKYSSRKFIFALLTALPPSYKIIFANGGPEWGWVLVGILGAYIGGNVAQKIKAVIDNKKAINGDK